MYVCNLYYSNRHTKYLEKSNKAVFHLKADNPRMHVFFTYVVHDLDPGTVLKLYIKKIYLHIMNEVSSYW